MDINKINEDNLIQFLSLFKILSASLKCDRHIPNEIIKTLVEALEDQGVYTKEDEDWARRIAIEYKKRLEAAKDEKAEFFRGEVNPLKIVITFEERWNIFWEIASPPKAKKNT